MRLQCCLEKCREIPRNAKKCREMQIIARREMQRNVEKCSALCICDDMMIIIDILQPTDFQKIKHM